MKIEFDNTLFDNIYEDEHVHYHVQILTKERKMLYTKMFNTLEDAQRDVYYKKQIYAMRYADKGVICELEICYY